MRKAQVTLFVVIAILIVASAAIVAYFKFYPGMPVQVKQVEDYFSSCVNDIVSEAVMTAGEQAGYVELPEVVSASDYAPFSSQFFFLGSKVPYWFYMSGNGIQKEQVPSLENIQKQISDYVKNALDQCKFDPFIEQGYEIKTEEVRNVKTTLYEHFILTEIDYPINVRIGGVSKRIETHKIGTPTEFGKLFSDAKQIYSEEQNINFLERYAIDALTLNAPTTDVVLSCAPKVWSQLQIENDVKKALQANIQTIKVKGSYYRLVNDKYFVHDAGASISENVNFLYDIKWPSVMEVWPSQDGVMSADPVGLQEGLGMLGFCYVPYHFVYSLRFPVMIQLMSGNELFQFPVVVIIDRNKARKAEVLETPEQLEAEMCKNKLEDVSVTMLNSDMQPINASISFKCHNVICSIGSAKASEGGTLSTKFPQCVNGFIVASSAGYKTTKYQVSTNEPAVVNIVMPKLYDLNVNLFADSRSLGLEETAIINFISSDYSASLYWPVQKSIRLAEGSYNVTAFMFKEGNFTLGAQTTRKCTKVPAAGVLGLLGFKTENCFDLSVPQQALTQIIAGGGRADIDITEDDMKTSARLNILIPQVTQPTDLASMQQAYILIDTNNLQISFA